MGLPEHIWNEYGPLPILSEFAYLFIFQSLLPKTAVVYCSLGPVSAPGTEIAAVVADHMALGGDTVSDCGRSVEL